MIEADADIATLGKGQILGYSFPLASLAPLILPPREDAESAKRST